MLTALTLFLLISRTGSQRCQYENSAQLTDNGVKYDNLAMEYYMHNMTEAERGRFCMKNMCFRKCCPSGQAFNESTSYCVPEPHQCLLPIYYNRNTIQLIKPSNAMEKIHYLYGPIECSEEKRELSIVLVVGLINTTRFGMMTVSIFVFITMFSMLYIRLGSYY